MTEALFWHLMGGFLVFLGAVALATAAALRARRQAWRVPLAYAVIAVAVGAGLLTLVGR